MFFRYVQREREEVIEEMDTVLLQEHAGYVTLIPMDTRLGSTTLTLLCVILQVWQVTPPMEENRCIRTDRAQLALQGTR